MLSLEKTKTLSYASFAELFALDVEDCRKNGRKLYLACSGGIDSMVLLALLVPLVRSQGIELELLHVNFGLRGEESEEDARFVVETAKASGLKISVLRAPPNPKGKSNLQNWARQVRYDWFRSLVSDHDRLILAHHEDDLIETILMRVVRGSSLFGLMGMKSREGILLRPLLSVTRQAIEAFAQKEGIAFREDSSNAGLDYSRNRLRHVVLPDLEAMFPGASRNLLELARSGQEWSRFFSESFERKNVRTFPESSQDWLELGFYPGSQLILSQLDAELGDSATRPSRQWLETLYQALVSGANTTLQLNEDYEFQVKGGSYFLSRKSKADRSSPRWRQFQGELTKSGLASCLSPGARLELYLDDDPEMQDNRNA